MLPLRVTGRLITRSTVKPFIKSLNFSTSKSAFDEYAKSNEKTHAFKTAVDDVSIFFIRYSPLIVGIGSVIAGVWCLQAELDRFESRVRELQKEMEGKFGTANAKIEAIHDVVEEKFTTTDAKIKATYDTMEEKFKTMDAKIKTSYDTMEETFNTTDAKIATSMEMAVKTSSENFFKYNYSTEYSRLHDKGASQSP